MRKILPLLLFLNTVNSNNNFKIKNDFFKVEGSSDNNGNITYAELKKCNHNPIKCRTVENTLKSIYSNRKTTSIEVLKKDLQKIAETTYDEQNSAINFYMATCLLVGALTIEHANSTTHFINDYSNSNYTVNGFGMLVAANITHSLLSAAVDNKSVFNKPLIATDIIIGAANYFFIAKAIAAAASPWATSCFLGLGILQRALNIFYRTSKPKTTVTISEKKD